MKRLVITILALGLLLLNLITPASADMGRLVKEPATQPPTVA